MSTLAEYALVKFHWGQDQITVPYLAFVWPAVQTRYCGTESESALSSRNISSGHVERILRGNATHLVEIHSPSQSFVLEIKRAAKDSVKDILGV